VSKFVKGVKRNKSGVAVVHVHVPRQRLAITLGYRTGARPPQWNKIPIEENMEEDVDKTINHRLKHRENVTRHSMPSPATAPSQSPLAFPATSIKFMNITPLPFVHRVTAASWLGHRQNPSATDYCRVNELDPCNRTSGAVFSIGPTTQIVLSVTETNGLDCYFS
jgi:hypothetical protein